MPGTVVGILSIQSGALVNRFTFPFHRQRDYGRLTVSSITRCQNAPRNMFVSRVPRPPSIVSGPFNLCSILRQSANRYYNDLSEYTLNAWLISCLSLVFFSVWSCLLIHCRPFYNSFTLQLYSTYCHLIRDVRTRLLS